MKSFLELLQNKIPTKNLLQIGFLSVVLLGITLANAFAKEDPKITVPATQKKADEEAHEEKAAALTDEQLKTAAIEIAQVGPADIRETISLYGTVEVNGEKTQRVAARFVGTVRAVNKKVGDTVREGEVLATVESNDSLKNYSLTSVINGVIAERHINVGEQTTDKTVFVIADLSSVWIDVAIFPRDAAKVRVGQTVRVSNPSSDVTGEGDIISVSALGSSANQSLTARVFLANADHEWIPGLFVNADVVLAKKSAALTIRNEALQDHEGKQVIFVKEQNGFEPRPIKVGRTDGEISEVLGGVKAGEIYASKNSFIIKAELGKGGAEHE